MDVQEDGGLLPDYKLKLNSYDLGVDIELNDAINRIRFEHQSDKRWHSFWYHEGNWDPKTWVDEMERDGIAERLVRHFDLKHIALYAWMPFLAADLGCIFGPSVVLFLQKRGLDLIDARRGRQVVQAEERSGGGLVVGHGDRRAGTLG